MKTKIMLLCAAFAAAACGNKSEVASEAAGDETLKENADTLSADSAKVEVDAVSSATNVANSPTFNGLLMVSPDRQATVSLTMGGRIHSLAIEPGKAVVRGQVLATLDNPDFIELQQTWLESAAQLDFLEKEYARQRSLGNDAASQKRIEQSRAEYLSMKSKADAAAAKLRTLGVSTKALLDNGIRQYLPVLAPISGYVTGLDANLGKYIDAGEAICDIIDKKQPMLQLTVYEKDISLMKVGKTILFRVNGMGKATFSATVSSIDQAVDKKDYSIKVYARVKDSNHVFRPGMYVRAKIVAE